jgi:hypothetical protein
MAATGKNVLMRRLVLPFALALAVAACGGGTSGSTGQATVAATTPSGSAQQAVLQAAAKGAAVKSARISFTVTMSGATPADGTFTGEGAFSAQKARVSIDMSQIGTGQLNGQIDAVFDHAIMYMRLPTQLAQRLPPGNDWIKFDLAKLGKEQGIDFGALFNQFGSSDPSRSLEFLKAAQADFREIGSEAVRGAETTHYRGTIDLEQLAEDAPANLREIYRQLAEMSKQARVRVDVWIDDQGRTRRMSYEQTMDDGSAMKLTQEYYDFGADVDVTTPPADQVLDITALLGNA